jgi:hypothetical protein
LRVENITYPHAGHYILTAIPGLALVRPDEGEMSTVESGQSYVLVAGGSEAANAARESLWPRILRFLQTLPASR